MSNRNRRHTTSTSPLRAWDHRHTKYYLARVSSEIRGVPILKIGIIGTGEIAREHALALASITKRVSLVAATDMLPGRLADFGEAFSVPRLYATAVELVADPEVELV